MRPWERLFGKRPEKRRIKAPSAAATPPSIAAHDESPTARIARLWETAGTLGWSDEERQEALGIYTELLTLVDEQSAEYNVCAILRNRAITYRSLRDYDAALEDLARELAIARKLGDHMRVLECQKITEETRELKRKDEIQREGGEKAARLHAMQEQGRRLWAEGPDFDAAFDGLFAALEDDDPDVRAEASRLLADDPAAVRKLISIQQASLRPDPRQASLAGRVLGRKAAKGSDDMIHAEIAQLMYGIAASFLPCPCVHCGHMNKGIAAPPRGPMVPYYHQSDDEGAYAIPVLCDGCGKEFFVVWDADPR